MPLRYLFGPVTGAFAAQNLADARAAGRCLAFNATGDGVDLALAGPEPWADLLRRLPGDFRPDFLALYLPYTCVPPWLWSAPLPLVGLAADWNLLWHGYRHLLPRCERVLTDAPGVEALRHAGLATARPAVLFGCERDLLALAAAEQAGPTASARRDVDILFVGNLHPAVQRERMPWLARLARTGRRVCIRTGVHGEEYRRLLRRARIVFNRSARGECNRRACEAPAAGALLFQEAGNRETAEFFRDRQECVFYTEDDLESLLEYYLTHETERERIARAGQARVLGLGFGDLWERALADLEAEWPDVLDRRKVRPALTPRADLPARIWQVLGAGAAADPALWADLSAALRVVPGDAELHNARGIVAGLPGPGGRTTDREAGNALPHFRRARECDPGHPLAALNLAEALAGLGQPGPATDLARATLARLEHTPPSGSASLDAPHFPAAFDAFRVEWERAAWAHAGRPAAERRAKRDLLRWRLHGLLADLTGDLVHAHESALARPDLPTSRARLGAALLRVSRPREAVPHLRQALADSPFDGEAARLLHRALLDCGDGDGAAALAADRRLLARAAPEVVSSEPWFAGEPPPADALASLVVLCCNEVAFTRLCLESVLAHTRPPYELILIDNGSSDDTPAYLAGVAARPGPARVAVVRNETNRGFPAGCNQGLAQVRGTFVVFLNNDAVVTPGWLDGLVAWARHDWPSVGLVGAVSNCVPAPQQVPADYADLRGLDEFAGRRRREFAGKAVSVERVSGFCLLGRRDVLEQVGDFDEQFGVGFFDDDDLGVRVREAGYRLLVALNVFVHHFGGRTFAGLGIDVEAQLRTTFEQFRAKWGDARCAPYRLPDRAPPSAPALPPVRAAEGAGPGAYRARVSLVLIVKDEEHNLEDCLRPLLGLVDETVVVDTGSSDRTREVAADLGARVFDFAWVDSFAAARNECLRHARGDWVLWVDADDRLDPENRERLRLLLAGLRDERAAYTMKCRCLPDRLTGTATVVDHVRLFRVVPGLAWDYRVHEQILPALRRLGHVLRWSDVVVQHTGYVEPDLRGRKLERDLRLLELERGEQPDHPFTLFNLGQVYSELGRHAEALPLLQRSLAASHPTDSIVRKLYALVANGQRRLGRPAEAAATCGEGLRVCPDDEELLFVRGLLRLEGGDLAGAEADFLRLLGSKSGEHFASVADGLRGYKARHNLGVVYRRQARFAEAEVVWREALAERPDHLPCRLELAELHLTQRRFDEVGATAATLEATAPLEAAVLHARVRLAHKDYAGTRALLLPAIAAHPQAVWPQLILSHALLQEGSDPDAAEEVLRKILELDPGHEQARNNLGVLLRERGRAADEAFAGVSLEHLYRQACATPSDINEHLPTLLTLARECRHVTEFGTRTGVSTTALLYAQPEVLVCYDVTRRPAIDLLARLAGRTEFVFREQDVLFAEVEETDLLFIDTWHVYEQLRQELALHGRKARKYVVLHDTTTFAEQGETAGHRGLGPAVQEFLAQGEFQLGRQFENNNGLTVLERRGPTGPRLESASPG